MSEPCPDCAARTAERGTRELCDRHRAEAYRGAGLYAEPTADEAREVVAYGTEAVTFAPRGLKQELVDAYRDSMAESIEIVEAPERSQTSPSVTLRFRLDGAEREVTFEAHPLRGLICSPVSYQGVPWYVQQYLRERAVRALALCRLDGKVRILREPTPACLPGHERCPDCAMLRAVGSDKTCRDVTEERDLYGGDPT